jgi:hypothetical protein
VKRRCGICGDDLKPGDPKQYFTLPETNGMIVRACPGCAGRLRRGDVPRTIASRARGGPTQDDAGEQPSQRPAAPPPAPPKINQPVALGRRIDFRRN